MATRNGNRNVFRTLSRVAAIWCGAAMLVGGAIGCASSPEATGPELEQLNHYSSTGVRFSYPGDWALDEQVDWDEETEVRTISVGHENMAGAYIKAFSPPSPELSLKSFVNRFTESLNEKVPDFAKIEGFDETETETELSGKDREGLRRTFQVEVPWTQFQLEVDFHRIDTDARTVFLLTLSSDANRSLVEPALDMIKRTLNVR